MAKKAKKRSKKAIYNQGWETRRRNAALAAATAANPSGPPRGRDIAGAQTTEREYLNRGTADWSANRTMNAGLAPATDATKIQESEFSIKARAIVVAARKKNGATAIENTLIQVALQAGYEATQRAEQHELEHLKAIHETNAINVVAAFMAEMEAIQTLNRGAVPPALMTSGFTIARVVDALAKAGYSKNGWKQPDRREEIMNRSRP